MLTMGLCAYSIPCLSEEPTSDAEKRAAFKAAYNERKAEERLDAVGKLEGVKEQFSIEMVYWVSWSDPDPEVRSRAFSVLVHCEDTYGYTAYLAADSFSREKEIGVKVEKAVAMAPLKYKWAALNELVTFLRTLRWNDWNWHWYNHSGGYIAAGTPPEDVSKKVTSGEGSSGDDYARKSEPLRWRNENELIAIIAGTVNKMTGTKMESRPRIDQEIVKWWERKSDLWAEYDRKLQRKEQEEIKESQFKELKTVIKMDELKPGKDTLRDLLSESKTKEIPKEVKHANPDKINMSLLDE